MLKIFLLISLSLKAEVNHNLSVEIFPEKNYIEVEDKISFEKAFKEKIFFLNKELGIKEFKGGEIKELSPEDLKKYTNQLQENAKAYLINSNGEKNIKIKYSGKINHSFKEIAQEYSRAFKETEGIITKEGCYLSESSFYYPVFEGEMLTFKMSVKLPDGYKAVSQGERIKNQDSYSIWEEKLPQDEIYLVCSKFKEYSIEDGKRKYYVFLQKEDEKLAEKYLENTKKYIDFYSKVIGEYPYKKFALVENFWDTGYGMPSFTLLGPKVIRLPFLISSSYPHEILHNWWGNGVFVDYKKGNWCEGLTVYLADYLIKENNGKGKEYRMNILQKYSDYVKKEKDFPVKEFIERHSSAQEAIGYGKAMMFYHMLRLKLGDEKFLKALRDFYSENKFKKANFEDLRISFEKVSGLNLKDFFEQWIDKSGAMDLKLKDVNLEKLNGKYIVNFTLEDLSENNYKDVKIPVVVRSKNNTIKLFVKMENKIQNFKLDFEDELLGIKIDPDFEVFRRLAPSETPVTLSRILGSEKPFIIIPSENKEKWEKLALLWQFDKNNLPQVKTDSDLSEIPKENSIWIFGKENKLFKDINSNLKNFNASINENYFSISNENISLSSKTIVFILPHPENPSNALAYIISDTEKIEALASKIPHYGKYSYLVFDKDLNLINSGLWEIENSNLRFDFSNEKLEYKDIEKPLVNLPSFFSTEKIYSHIKFLSKDIKERFPETEGFEKAKKYIISELKKYGLKPFYKDYEQSFKFNYNGKELKTSNIIAKIDGKTKKDEYLILSAHYDHLKSEKGIFYPGANDNASGVALLLELSRYYSKKPLDRTIIFAFFSAEEEGRLGSKFFISNFLEKEKINAGLNFDTIGRLKDRDIIILNSDSSESWKYILRGAGFTTQINYKIAKERLDSSDDFSLIESTIPAIQFFDGGDINYHKPSDTIETIDVDGIAKVGEFAKEIIEYLASDSDFIKRPQGANFSKGQGEKRKVFTGLVPDFSFNGDGVMAQEIVKNSPLEKSGLKSGDIIIKVNSQSVKTLKEYSDILKKLNPGEKINITYISNGKENNAEIVLMPAQ